MKTKLSFGNLHNDAKRRAKMSSVLQQQGLQFEADVKLGIQRSQPAGRTYRRSRLTRTVSRNTPKGLRTFAVGSGPKKAAVGYTFHRASRRGQPPAIDTGRLINSIRMVKISPLRVRVIVGAAYGGVLDAKNGLDRPFFLSVFDKNREKYLEPIRAELLKAG